MCFGGGNSYPAPAPLPPAPSTDAATALARVQSERVKALAATGMGGNILTGGLGASDFGTAGKGTTVLGQTDQSLS